MLDGPASGTRQRGTYQGPKTHSVLLEGWEHSESVIFKEVRFKTQTEPPLGISSEGQTSRPLPTKASTAEMSSSQGWQRKRTRARELQ